MKKISRLTGVMVLLAVLAAAPLAAQQDPRDAAARAPSAAGSPLQPLAAAVDLSSEPLGPVLITNRSYRQIFEPYLFPQGPIFITGDAVLQAYHVLLAHSLGRFVQAATPELQRALRLMRRQVSSEGQQRLQPTDGRQSGAGEAISDTSAVADYLMLRQRARLRGQIVVAVALQLLGETDQALEPDIAAIVDAEVRKVEAADKTAAVEWLEITGGEGLNLDYTGFRPYGFFVRSDALKRVFRAVRWLQSIPFRSDSDEQLLAILILSKALTSAAGTDSSERRAAENFLRCYRDLFGRKTDTDLLFAAGILKDRPTDLDAVRQRLQSLGSPPASEGGYPAAEPLRSDLYVIAPSRFPDEAFFRSRSRIDGFRYSEPNGLEICALLGSDYARRQLELRLPEVYRQSLRVEVDRFFQAVGLDSLHDQYLHTVGALVDPPEPDAPAFTREPAWEAKSCNTALAGWVQLRRRFPTTQRPASDAIEEDFSEVPAGFVEPDPEFFDRLGELSGRAAGILDRCGALPTPAVEFAAQLRRFDQLLAAGRFSVDADQAPVLTPQEQVVVEKSIAILSTLEELRIDPAAAAQQKEVLRAILADVADGLVDGIYDQNPAYQALVLESGMDLKQRWQRLRSICRRLEVMAHKQLRGVAFNEKEAYFLTDFGTTLAEIMLYSADTYRQPRDDAPVAFTFYFDPLSQKHMHAAVARPREIIVSYPFGDRQVLCRGAVLPYYEFIAAADVTDERWRQRLDSDERPSVLRWLDPVVQAGVPQKSWRRIEQSEPMLDLQVP